MVGFSRNEKEEEEDKEMRFSLVEHESSVENNKILDDSFSFSLPDIYDFSFPFTDSFVDFDPIKEWLEEDPPIGPPPYSMDDEFLQKTSVVNDKEISVEKSIEKGSEEFSIEEELMRVNLNCELNDFDMSKINNGGVLGEKSDDRLYVDGNGCDKDENGSESESDEDEKPNIAGGEVELEEGEIMAFQAKEMVAWSDDDDDDDVGTATKGPIRSKNEIVDLPPVPPVNVSLLPHHHTLPVGIISSILGHQVIVEGVERHNPLSEGSIVWITESRTPLGIIDEIFGPVKSPYYVVRYNSETQVPSGIGQGTQISFVPEFADHVLNAANLYSKGYDASGENDEEFSEEAEFSDDEKEAEYRKMLKMKKRQTNDHKSENKKKDKRNTKNRFALGKHKQFAAKQTHDLANNFSTQHFVQPSATLPIFSSGLTQSHPFPQLGMAPASSASSSNNVFNGDLSPSTVSTGFPINPQMTGMPGLQRNHPQPVLQAPILNVASFQRNIHMNPSLPSNYGPGPAFSAWPDSVPPNFFSQTLYGMGMQGHNAPTLTNIGANVSSGGFQHGSVPQFFFNQSVLGMGMQCNNGSTHNGFQQMAKSDPGQDTFQNFNPGNNRGGGRRPYHSGGGHFGGGRGRHPS